MRNYTAGRVGWGQKIYRKGRVESGGVQFGQRLKFNFKVPWYLYFSLHNVLAVYSVPSV